MTELTEKQMEEIARDYEYLHGIQKSRRCGSVVFTSPIKQIKTMTELTEKQKEQMEAELKPAIKKQGFSESFYIEKMYFMRGFKAGYTAAVNRECVWTWYKRTALLETSCGVDAIRGKPSRPDAYCRYCGGKVVEEEV